MAVGSTTLQAVLEHMPISIVISSLETGHIIWTNARNMELAGATSPDQLEGRSLLEFILPEQQGIALRDIERVAQGESPPSVIYRLRRLDGGSADVQISSIPMMYQGQRAMLSLVADVTEQQRATRELAESEARYRNLVDGSTDGVVVVLGEDIVFANRAVVHALGVGDVTEILGKSMYGFIAPDERKAVRDARKDILTTGEPLPAMPVTLVRPDGSLVRTTARTDRISWHGEEATQTTMRDLDIATSE